MKACRYPNCGVRIEGTYCPKHNRSAPPSKTSQEGWYKTGHWAKARRMFLRGNPVCVRCGHAAQVVDHITPHRGDGELFWDTTNWQPLCLACHNSKSNHERRSLKQTT